MPARKSTSAAPVYQLKVTLKGSKPPIWRRIQIPGDTNEYDFGDSWLHEILVEKILPREPDARYPRCLTGKRACPPEDCGGIWGYADFLDAIRDPNHPEHEAMLEWIGDDFDPEAFDLQTVNQELGAL
jgi:hypothetical protein